jgi:uncharacterized protein YndB with AHSA1/START domain
MEKLQLSIDIAAPPETVWDTTIEDASYREWTKHFEPTSFYRGSWTKGSKILFLGRDKDGNEGGMSSEIAESRRPEFISIRHLGMVNNGVEDLTSDAVKAWAPSYEDYTLEEIDGGTRFVVEMDINAEHKEMFEKMWPEALKSLKALAEARVA